MSTEEDIRRYLCEAGELPADTGISRAMRLISEKLRQADKPLQLVMYCPRCQTQHIDEPWTAPHITHHCSSCNANWSPARTATMGVPGVPRTALDNWPPCDPTRFSGNATRDSDGYLWHPNLPEVPGDTPIQPYLDQIGWECHFSDMEAECTEEQIEACNETGDCSSWQPACPEYGKGWVLVSIFPTEEGVTSLWVRPQVSSDRLGPDCTPVPFDLEKAVAEAQKRLHQFIDRIAVAHTRPQMRHIRLMSGILK